MRRPLLLVLASLAACAPQRAPRPPPSDAFYFPTGVAYHDGGAPTLFVVSSNFDRRFDDGSVTAVTLSAVSGPDGGLPGFNDPAVTVPRQLPDLGLGTDAQVLVRSLGGEVDFHDPGTGTVSLFVPSRSENDPLQVVNATGGVLTCPSVQLMLSRDCGDVSAVSLTTFRSSTSGIPAASEPVGVAVDRQSGDVYVTHMQPVDSPEGSRSNFHSYLVNLKAATALQGPAESNFWEIGTGASHAAAIGTRYVYVSGRDAAPVLRMVDRLTGAVVNPALETANGTFDTRGIALRADESMVYLASTSVPGLPGVDALLHVSISDPLSATPSASLVRLTPMASRPTTLKLWTRPDGSALVIAASTGGAEVSIFDERVDAFVARVPLEGLPYGMAVEDRGAEGARVFITTFAAGQVAVLDIPADQPQAAKVVAIIGKNQQCIAQPTECE